MRREASGDFIRRLLARRFLPTFLVENQCELRGSPFHKI
jgi:hypothetical protein